MYAALLTTVFSEHYFCIHLILGTILIIIRLDSIIIISIMNYGTNLQIGLYQFFIHYAVINSIRKFREQMKLFYKWKWA